MNWDGFLYGVWQDGGRLLGSTFLVAPWLSWPLLLALLLAGLAGLLVSAYLAITRTAALRATERELATTREALEQRDTSLAAAKLQIQDLKQDSAPLLQMIHELRAPAASIQTTLDVLLQGYTANNEVARDEMLRLARTRAEMMVALINDLLTLGTTEQGGAQTAQVAGSGVASRPVRLSDILWEVMPQMRIKATLRGVHLRPHVPDTLPLIHASDEHMRQLLTNLIDNAIKYTSPEGEVSVTLREEGGRVIGEVADTGIGISEADKPHIFERFYRAGNAKEVEAYGTGLGLSVVKQVVQQHGGQLSVESELGKGTKFTFSFATIRPRRGTDRTEPQTEHEEDWTVTVMQKEAI